MGHRPFTFDCVLVEMSETFTGRGARALRPLVRWFWRRQLRALRRHLERRRPGPAAD